jgi:hypothetical protein
MHDEKIAETVEVAILVFVIVGVLANLIMANEIGVWHAVSAAMSRS